MSSTANTFATNPTILLTRDSVSSSGPRLIGPRPFYRSQVTPEPFDYTNQHRQLVVQNLPPRRYSVHQLNALDDDDNASISLSSSSESLSLEFPPPPIAFLTSMTADDSHRSPSNNEQRKNPLVSNLFSQSNSGSPLSNTYLSDHESSAPTRAMQTNYHPGHRATNTTNRALISVSSGQTPVITIAGSPQRSEIRVSSSPQTTKSTLREIRISRPDSPTISINRTASNQPLILTTSGNHSNGTTISNVNGSAFHISLGPPTQSAQRGRTSLSMPHQVEMRRDSVDNNRYTSNVLANRIQPFANCINNNSAVDRTASVVNLPPAPSSTSLTLRNGQTAKREGSDTDHLTKFLLKSMNTSSEQNLFGMCARCNDEIVGEENGLVAMDRMYHVPCFTCTMCGCRLRGMHFYSMENQPYCESCYINSLEKCIQCARPITDRILRATGKPYHAQCFCCVTCQKSLDGVPFTVDANMEVHCIECFHQKFAPRCFSCHRTILPNPGQQETTRIVTLDRNYHIDCYRCENCQVQFTTEEGCYPLDEHMLCLECNRLYSRTILGHS